MPSQRQKLVFRPRARLVSVLGEHLISDQAVGLIELVKNSYDADATHVLVEITDTAETEKTCVVVKDDGFGMTLSDVQDKWLSPAVDHKDKAKREQKRSPKGRLPIGEKGVGRFAVHQLARRFELVSRAKSEREVVVQLDWDEFDEGGRFLDNVEFPVLVREPEVFTGAKTGTRLTMMRARSPWQERLLKKVNRTLRMLQSPLRETGTSFEVKLKCPEYPQYENLAPSDIISKAHYEFRALVTGEGQCDYEYICQHPELAPRKKTDSQSLIPLAKDDLQGDEPACGQFYLNLYVFDRTKNLLAERGVSRQELDAQCGVSIFRDGLRVLPYGEPGDDWLFLDQDRIQAPSERIGNNQTIGIVQVDQSSNLSLRDKTNREGLIENDAFLDLRAMIRAAIKLFLAQWKRDRPRPEGGSPRRRGSVVQAKTIATAIKKSARDDVKVQVPPDSLPDGRNDTAAGKPATVTQPQALEFLIENLDGAEQTMKERERRLEVLLELAGTGLAAERVVHEFGRQVKGALEALGTARAALRSNEAASDALATMEACLGALRNEFRVLAPFEAVERAQKAASVDVREAAELALALHRSEFEASKIEAIVEGGGFSVRGRAAALVQVLDNLVHNACYWLSTGKKFRRLGILIDKKRKSIIVADSGPGVQDDAVDHVFDPFFTMKAGGRGLGLYISQELMRVMGGRLRLATEDDSTGLPKWATGAVFVVELPEDKR